jgi:adenylate cyclase
MATSYINLVRSLEQIENQMKITPRLKQELIVMAWTVGLVIICGGIIGFFVALSLGINSPILGVAQGMFTGALIATLATSISNFYPNTQHGQWLKHLSFKKSLLVGFVAYLFIIMFGIRIGVAIFFRVPIAEFSWLTLESIISLIISGVLAIFLTIAQQVNRMLGQGVIRNFLSGAYHKPREEERVFLFIDLVGSTGIAERIGAIKFHALLDKFFYDLTDPVLAEKGEIHKYVGDEVIISWPVVDEKTKGNPITCFFAFKNQINANSEQYETQFGFVPGFRGALHSGPVVTGEMGDIKREIVFLGDTVNTSSRIIGASSDLDQTFLASAAALARIPVPGWVTDEPLGPITLRGRQKEVELHALKA